jgi:lysophospholipase L1-like esterase
VAPARRGADLHALGNLLSGRTLHAGAGEPATQAADPAVVGSGSLAALAVATVVLAAASAVEMALLYHPGFDPSRLYDGTDTRAFGLLLGAALAMLWPSRELSERIGGGARLLLEALGVAGLAGIGVLMWRTDQYSPFLYPYGMVLLSVATVMVVASVTHPATRIGRALGWAPLRWVGSRSYAIYLWHYPVIILTDPKGSAPPSAVRDLAQIAVTLALAELSWRLVETPARSGRVSGIQWRRPKPLARPRPGMVLAAVSVSAVIAAAVIAIPHLPAPAAVPSSATLSISSPVTTAVTAPPSKPPGGRAGRLAAGSGTGVAGRGVVGGGVVGAAGRGGSAGAPVGMPASAVSPAPSRTRCTQVVHIGDSTSESLVSPAYLPDPAQRLGAQYARVGAVHSTMEISGGRSIVETLNGQPNGQTVAQGLVRSGYHGCWVIALGTNDAADVYVGSNVGDAQRIQRMMSVIGNQPVLWVDAVSLVSSGPYAEANMQRWNRALLQACRAYPNLAVFDWASLAQPSWFISDGIHYTSAGSAKRAAAFADALAAAFPARGAPATGAHCLVRAAPNWYLPAYKG